MPNSSTSIVSGAIVAALITKKGPPARFDASWIVRATSSLPEPGVPVIMMREFAGAMRSINWRSWFIAVRFADDAVCRAGARPQLADFTLQARSFDCPIGDKHEAVRLERLFDEIIGAEFHRRNRRLDIAVAGNHHDGQSRMFAL